MTNAQVARIRELMSIHDTRELTIAEWNEFNRLHKMIGRKKTRRKA